jgi:hypothetical protein
LIASTVYIAAQLMQGSPQAQVLQAAAAAANDSMATSSEWVEVWVVLSEPALASLPRDAADERAALRRRIERQQHDVMAQLVTLGAVESARVQQVRNAIAVRIAPAAIESAKKIKGVTGVHPVSRRNRIHD